jgi:signal peptidase I
MPPENQQPQTTSPQPTGAVQTSDVLSNPKTPKRDKSDKSGILSYVGIFVVALLLALLINAFVLQSYVVVGTSMTPTLQNGNRLIVDKIPLTWHKIFGGSYTPKRGDVVIFNSPIKLTENGQPADQLIKRVIGLPGDHVVVKNGKIAIYNSTHPDGFNPDAAPYGKVLPPTSGEVDLTVPDGYIFVCGDNRVPGGSLDSRTELGPIPLKNIVGKLVFRYTPVNEMTSF